jgi:arylsulfatase A-like enzyme
MIARASLFLLALLLAACRREAPAPTPVRLFPGLGTASYLSLEGETRPAVLLRPGEARSCRVTVPREGRLRFSLGFKDPPPETAVEFTVKVDGKDISRRVLATDKRGWRREEVALEAHGTLTIELAVRLTTAPPVGSGAEAAGRAWVAIGSPRIAAPSRGKPRVVLWLSQDTLRADHTSAFGHLRPTTPNLDALAREAVVFEDAVATAPWTLASLASQFTSRYPAAHGATHKDFQKDAAHPTLFDVLASQGFTVLGITGNSFVSADFGLAGGFDGLWYVEGRAAELNHAVQRALREWDGGDLALFVHYMDPHYSYAPPEPYDRAFDPGYRGAVDGVNFRSLGPGAASSDVEHVKALYDGEIAYTDAEIGRLLGRLRQQGLVEGAVILYTADHGDELLDHGGWYHGHTLYRELLHVPFVLRLPGLAPRRVKEPVSMIDVAPTVLDALRIPSPDAFQGESLMPMLNGGRRRERTLFAELQNDRARPRKFAAREGALEYIATVRWPQDQGEPVLKEELYDLAADPTEKHDLKGAPGRERLREQARRYLEMASAAHRPQLRATLSPETVESLRALGYVD